MKEMQVLSLGQEDRSRRGGNGNPLQYSCLENLMDRGAWRATVLVESAESDTAEHATNYKKLEKEIY